MNHVWLFFWISWFVTGFLCWLWEVVPSRWNLDLNDWVMLPVCTVFGFVTLGVWITVAMEL